MAPFTSDRERRLWLYTAAVVIAIYATLGLAGTLAGALRARNLLGVAFGAGFLAVIVAVVGIALRRRPGSRELWVGVGVAAAYGMVLVRMAIEERTHLFEYGLVAVLIHAALDERRRGGRRVPAPPVLAVVATALLGWLDEAIQTLIPSRTHDLRDVGVNALAGVMAVSASVLLSWARRRIRA